MQTSVLELWELCAKATGYFGKPNFAPARAGELQANALDASFPEQSLLTERENREFTAYLSFSLQYVR